MAHREVSCPKAEGEGAAFQIQFAYLSMKASGQQYRLFRHVAHTRLSCLSPHLTLAQLPSDVAIPVSMLLQPSSSLLSGGCGRGCRAVANTLRTTAGHARADGRLWLARRRPSN